MKRITILVIIVLVVIAGYFVWTYMQNQKIEEATTAENGGENTAGERFTGTITAYDTGCFADATCSVTVDGNVVVLVTGGRGAGEQAVGSLTGVESIGDLEQKIGSQAEVYAAKTDTGEYTVYGNAEYFVNVK